MALQLAAQQSRQKLRQMTGTRYQYIMKSRIDHFGAKIESDEPFCQLINHRLRRFFCRNNAENPMLRLDVAGGHKSRSLRAEKRMPANKFCSSHLDFFSQRTNVRLGGRDVDHELSVLQNRRYLFQKVEI